MYPDRAAAARAGRGTGRLAGVRRHAARAVVLLRGGACRDLRPEAHPARGAGGYPRLARRLIHWNDRGVRPGPLPGPGGVDQARGLLRQLPRGRTARRHAPAVRQDHDRRQERRRVHDRDPAGRRPAAPCRCRKRRRPATRRAPGTPSPPDSSPPASTVPTRWTRPWPATNWPVPSCSRPVPRPGARVPGGNPTPPATRPETITRAPLTRQHSGNRPGRDQGIRRASRPRWPRDAPWSRLSPRSSPNWDCPPRLTARRCGGAWQRFARAAPSQPSRPSSTGRRASASSRAKRNGSSRAAGR